MYCISDRSRARALLPALLALLIAACGTTSNKPAASSRANGLPAAGSGHGGYYLDDGPGDHPPEGLLNTPDAEPKIEPYLPRANKPYVVFGTMYTPITDDRPFRQRGVGSWYGRKFHGQRTSSGEPYDMYGMTAAHPTLPIPSYARVTNLENGKKVIVRINDRGPFLSQRIIDLSYTAALKLGYLGKGSSRLEVERILPAEIEKMAHDRRNGASADAQPAASQPDGAEALAVAAPDLQPAAAVTAVTTVATAATTSSTSAPVAPAVLTPASLPAASPAPGFYLQLGAFSRAEHAQAQRALLAAKWQDGLPPVEMVEGGPLVRLYSGPFATRDEAAAAAQRIVDAGIAKPLIVRR